MKFAFLFLLSAQVHASESDRFCEYLGKLTADAQTALTARSQDPSRSVDERLKDITALGSQFQRLESLSRQAVNDRLTFAQFRERMASQGQEVTPSYEMPYLTIYGSSYCGGATVKTVLRYENGNKTEDTRTVTFEKQFDPTNHPYYQGMPR